MPFSRTLRSTFSLLAFLAGLVLFSGQAWASFAPTSSVVLTAEANSGRLENNFNRREVEKELALQVEVTKQFSENAQYVQSVIRSEVDDLTRKAKEAEEAGNPLDAARLYGEAADLQNVGLLLNMVTSGLGAPTDAAGGILAHTLSPLAAYEIGQYFKGEGAEGGAAHILAHMVLSGAVAAAGGQDVLSAALAAGGAEGFKP